MTKQEIIRELRRSACGDACPGTDVDIAAWVAADKFWHHGDLLYNEWDNQYRTWMLIVATAMEGEE